MASSSWLDGSVVQRSSSRVTSRARERPRSAPRCGLGWGADVDRAGVQVGLGHPEGLFDAPQLVVPVQDRLAGEHGFAGADQLVAVEAGFGLGAGPIDPSWVSRPVRTSPGGVDGFGGDVLLDAAFVRAPVTRLVGGERFGAGEDLFAGVAVAFSGLG